MSLWPGSAKRRPEQVQQTAFLFDHLVGDGKQRRGHFEAHHPGRLSVDDQLKLARLHDRQVRGPRAFENTTGVDADLTIAVQDVRSVTY